MLRENWGKSLEALLPTSVHERREHQRWESRFDSMIEGIVEYCYEEAKKEDSTTEAIIRFVSDSVDSERFGAKGVKKDYGKLYYAYKRLIDTRRQDSWADYHERLRYLLFRILTAVGIAAVVLGTGYLAKCWNIPLPLLRVAS